MWSSQKSRSFSEVGDSGTWGEMAIKLVITQHEYQGKMAMKLVILPSLFHQEFLILHTVNTPGSEMLPTGRRQGLASSQRGASLDTGTGP